MLIIEYFKHRMLYSTEQISFWQENKRVVLLALSLFVCVLVIRSWANYTHPGLYVEDTSHYFNHFYGDNRGLDSLLHNPNGYHNIVNNFVALVVAKIDVRWQPTLYLIIATLFSVSAVMVLPCSGLLRNKYVIFAAPFLLGLSGLNHIFYYITLAYQIYVLIILLLGLLFWQPLQGNIKNVVLCLLLSLLVWSGPYSVLVIPFSCAFIFFFRGKTKLLIILSIVTLAYTLSVTEHMILLRNFWKIEIHRIWFNTFIAKIVFMGLKGGVGPFKILITGGFFAALLVIFRKDTFYLKVACILLALVYGSLGALFLSKKFLLSLTIRPCYIVISQFLWLFFLLFTADRLLSLQRRFYHAGIIVCLLVAVFVAYDNYKVPAKRIVPVMAGLPQFLDRVHLAEKEWRDNPDRIREIRLQIPSFSPAVYVGNTNDSSLPVEQIIIPTGGALPSSAVP